MASSPREFLDQSAHTIIEKLIECAVAGDLGAIRLCVERILPRSKPNNGIHFELPEGGIDSGDNMLQIAHNVTKSVADGEMTIEEAEKFTRFLQRQRRQIDEAEHKQQEEEWKKKSSR